MRHASIFALVLASVATLAACGDNGGSDRPDSRPRPDARIGPDASDIDADTTLPDASDIDAPVIDAAVIDAAVPDANTIDAAPGVADHLLITEVRTVGGDEFVEIHNPTGAAVSLTNYYLSDVNNYWALPGHVAGNTTITVDSSDFLMKFPNGASIAAGATIVVSTDAPVFETTYAGVTADYSLQELSATSVAMVNTIPSAGTQNPGLTNAGEMVVLFAWDGATDLVQDVDFVLAGNAPTAANSIIAKAPVDGPDGDTTTSAYATDALTLQDMASDTSSTPTDLQTYKRIALEGANEVSTGGNGITGHDETSEQSRTTWDSNAASTYTAATPKAVPTF